MEPLVEIKNLSVRFPEGDHLFEAVKGISFEIGKGEILGVVGESGSGKSMSALTLMGLLPRDAQVASGEVLFEGRDLLSMDPDERRTLRGSRMAMVFQEPMTSLNPVLKIEKQVGESLRLHGKFSEKEIHERVIAALQEVGLSDAEAICSRYPHELSGGMRQRVMLAQAAICSPQLIIADEPTTALDCVVQAQILELFRKIHREKGTSILFISHDLNVIRELCSRVLVVYHGEIVEEGETERVLMDPQHEYTRHLVASIPERSKEEKPGEEVLRLSDLQVYYDVRGGLFQKKRKKHVIHGVSLTAREGEILGIVGESGCGKSTLCKTILGLHDQYEGEVWVKEGMRPQMVFQDPYGSLNPARTIGWILEEPLKMRGIRDKEERIRLVGEMLENVGLDASFASRRPSELSGGQRQRISIGAALLMDSRLIIADEPVSALDVTVQSQILKLLLRIHEEKGMTILLISHDLNVVRRLCRRVLVIYRGVIVEEGEAEDVYGAPAHPYTKLLLAATASGEKKSIPYSGLPERPDETKAGEKKGGKDTDGAAETRCVFFERCPERCEACGRLQPDVVTLENGHWSRCLKQKGICGVNF